MEWVDIPDRIALLMYKYDSINYMFEKPVRRFTSMHHPLIPAPLITALDPRSVGATTFVNATTDLFRRSENGTINGRLLTLEVLVTSTFLPFKASDPRDSVYAVLSMARDEIPDSLPLEGTPSRVIRP
jgi:hypothetical protein